MKEESKRKDDLTDAIENIYIDLFYIYCSKFFIVK